MEFLRMARRRISYRTSTEGFGSLPC